MKTSLIFLMLLICVSTICNGMHNKRGRGGKQHQASGRTAAMGPPTEPYVTRAQIEQQLEEEKKKNSRLASELQESEENRKRLCKEKKEAESSARVHLSVSGVLMRKLMDEKQKSDDLEKRRNELEENSQMFQNFCNAAVQTARELAAENALLRAQLEAPPSVGRRRKQF